MARWFLSGTDAMTAGQEKGPGEAFFSQEAPLGSVVMLASSGASFTTPFGTTLTPERPSIDNIRGAYDAWQERLALNANSRGLFYFCGHGVSDGLTQLLVADDFGENKSRPFDAVFHLSNTVQGTIRKAKASLFYFIDACMELSQEIINQIGSPQPLLDSHAFSQDVTVTSPRDHILYPTRSAKKPMSEPSGNAWVPAP